MDFTVIIEAFSGIAKSLLDSNLTEKLVAVVEKMGGIFLDLTASFFGALG